jgi:hypothetical protein
MSLETDKGLGLSQEADRRMGQPAEGFPSAQAICGSPLSSHVYSPCQGFHVYPHNFRMRW